MDWSAMFAARTVVLGCGNILFGDDAAGPLLIELLGQDPDLPRDVALVDAGTGVRNLLFDLIVVPGLAEPQTAGSSPPHGPTTLILVDAATQDGVPAGEIREIDPAQLSPRKISDMSLHLFPTVNLLQDLQRSTGIRVRIVTIQTGRVPDTMDQGLSPEVRDALPRAAALVKRLCNQDPGAGESARNTTPQPDPQESTSCLP